MRMPILLVTDVMSAMHRQLMFLYLVGLPPSNPVATALAEHTSFFLLAVCIRYATSMCLSLCSVHSQQNTTAWSENVLHGVEALLKTPRQALHAVKRFSSAHQSCLCCHPPKFMRECHHSCSWAPENASLPAPCLLCCLPCLSHTRYFR